VRNTICERSPILVAANTVCCIGLLGSVFLIRVISSC
jgi:hypothetical protein